MLHDRIFSSDNEFFFVGLFSVVHYTCGRADIVSKLDYLRCTLRVNEEKRIGVLLFGFEDFLDGYSCVCRTAALKELDILFGALLLYIVAEVAVGDKQYLIAVKSVYYAQCA